MHHCHVNSTSRRHVDRVLGLLETCTSERLAGHRRGLPLRRGQHRGRRLLPGPRAARRVGPAAVVASSMVATGERIASRARLAELRAQDPGAVCVVEFLDEDDPEDAAMLQRALAFPDAIVASDAMHVEWPDGSTDSREWPLPEGGQTHPRTAGTFARSLRRMVRETGSGRGPRRSAAARTCPRGWSTTSRRPRATKGWLERRRGRRPRGHRSRARSPTGRRTSTRRGPPSAFGTCSSTARSWSGTVHWTSRRSRAGRSAPRSAESPWNAAARSGRPSSNRAGRAGKGDLQEGTPRSSRQSHGTDNLY